MTEMKNMMVTDEALENINGGESAFTTISTCVIGIHEIPRNVRIGFNYEGSYYWYGECPKCGKLVFAKDKKAIPEKEFDTAWFKFCETF